MCFGKTGRATKGVNEMYYMIKTNRPRTERIIDAYSVSDAVRELCDTAKAKGGGELWQDNERLCRAYQRGPRIEIKVG